MTNKNVVPKRAKEIATAPFVRNATPGLTDILESSGNEQNHIRSRRKKIERCNVPKN